jgi:hypothetical protein
VALRNIYFKFAAVKDVEIRVVCKGNVGSIPTLVRLARPNASAAYQRVEPLLSHSSSSMAF